MGADMSPPFGVGGGEEICRRRIPGSDSGSRGSGRALYRPTRADISEVDVLTGGWMELDTMRNPMLHKETMLWAQKIYYTKRKQLTNNYNE